MLPPFHACRRLFVKNISTVPGPISPGAQVNLLIHARVPANGILMNVLILLEEYLLFWIVDEYSVVFDEVVSYDASKISNATTFRHI